jgi:hypothetical protein
VHVHSESEIQKKTLMVAQLLHHAFIYDIGIPLIENHKKVQNINT